MHTAYLCVPINISLLLLQDPVIFPPDSIIKTELVIDNVNLTFVPLKFTIPVDLMLNNEAGIVIAIVELVPFPKIKFP